MKKLTLVLLAAASLVCSAAENPLLEKRLPIPFDRIRAEHVVPAIEFRLQEARQRRDAFAAATGPRTYANTMAAFATMFEDLDQTMNVVHHLDTVASTPALRAAVSEVVPKVAAFTGGVALDAGIYARIKEYAAAPEAKALTGPRKRYLQKTLEQFHRNGADLGEKDKARLREIGVELSRASKKFADNVLDATNAFEHVITDPAKLAGLPESARAAARQSAQAKSVEGWRFTLQAPSYLAVMNNLDDASVREKFYRANSTKAAGGAFDNRPLMKRILELRRERALLLGYRNFADLQADDRMAKSGDRVREFLATLERKTRPAFEKEAAELLAFRRSTEGPNAPPLAPWDVNYYVEKMRKARYDIDEESLRPYFSSEAVMKGMFDVVERLYGVKVVRATGVPVPNPAAQFFDVRDSDGSLLGSFYADLYPRDDKRSGAWMSWLVPGGPTEAGFEPHLGTINANVAPPSADKPSLLSGRDPATIFHEFGHLVSFVLGRPAVRGMSDVAWDFVELPSQFMENYTWERACLDLFARHYQTGEPLPDSLFQKMLRARNYRAASLQMTQLGYATLDLYLHTAYDEAKDGEILPTVRKIMQGFSAAPLPDDFAMAASFSHIWAGGYAAGYYSYKWAEVLDADAFTRFQKNGIFDRKTGLEFRRKLLEKGGTEDADVLFRDFMGRDPDPDALLRRSGLLPAK